jgi:hypothetical protein
MKNNGLHLAFLKHQYDLIKFEIRHFKARINIIDEHYNFIVDNEECFMSAHQVKKYLAKRFDERTWIEVKINLLEEELERLEIQLDQTPLMIKV